MFSIFIMKCLWMWWHGVSYTAHTISQWVPVCLSTSSLRNRVLVNSSECHAPCTPGSSSPLLQPRSSAFDFVPISCLPTVQLPTDGSQIKCSVFCTVWHWANNKIIDFIKIFYLRKVWSPEVQIFILCHVGKSKTLFKCKHDFPWSHSLIEFLT